MKSLRKAQPDLKLSKAEAMSPNSAPLKIIFFHPDLGIGGAERLILDAALGLQARAHAITIYTSHRDPSHAFDEARDGTLDVRVRGGSLFPRTCFGMLHVLLAVVRQVHLFLSVAVLGRELQGLRPDVFVVDQLPAIVPLLRWWFPGTADFVLLPFSGSAACAGEGAAGGLGGVKEGL